MFHDTETVLTCSKVWILTNQVNINRRVQPDNHIPATYEITPAFINLPQYLPFQLHTLYYIRLLQSYYITQYSYL